MWPGIAVEPKIKERELIQSLHNEKMEEIESHFGGSIKNNWFINLFTFPVLIATDLNILKKYGFCENCINYKGPNRIKRKLYNISILNSYCMHLARTIKFNDRCVFWEPKKLYDSIIRKHAEEACNKYKNEMNISKWYNPFKNLISEEY